jgi:hypothetical protein
MHADPKGFLHRYVDEIAEHFGEAALPRFAGGAAQKFLGLTDPTRPNRQRVLDRVRDLKLGKNEVPASLRRVMALTELEIAGIESDG